MKENKKLDSGVSRRAVLTGGAIAAASLAIPRPALGAMDCTPCGTPSTLPTNELSPLHREFLMLWILLTQGAVGYPAYDAVAGTVAKDILNAITCDVRNELNNTSWYWPNLCKGLALTDRCTASDPAFKLASDVCATQAAQSANGHGVYYWVQQNLKDNSPNNPPWPGNAPHPGIHAIVTALGIH